MRTEELSKELHNWLFKILDNFQYLHRFIQNRSEGATAAHVKLFHEFRDLCKQVERMEDMRGSSEEYKSDS